MRSFSVCCCFAFCFYAIAARAQPPAGTEGDYVVENFHFRPGKSCHNSNCTTQRSARRNVMRAARLPMPF